MSYNSNPFLGRKSEETTSEQEFVQLFSPKILELLPEDTFKGAIHIFRSPPGGGKTTLFRAFTPSALRAFWNTKNSAPEQRETYQRLLDRNVFDSQEGPRLLGVLLSCASGYADLPPGASIEQEGLFRALFDCRVVLRSMRSLAALSVRSSVNELDDIRVVYSDAAKDLKSIPQMESALELLKWAELREREVYAKLDAIGNVSDSSMPAAVRFESVIWLQEVRFFSGNKEIAPVRLLMVDDLHKLRRKQRNLLIDELTVLRPNIPLWLAERNIALGEKLLSQGAREGRDINEHDLDEFWSTPKGQHQFSSYAQNILERRLRNQSLIPPAPFENYLRTQIHNYEIEEELSKAVSDFFSEMEVYKNNEKYVHWFSKAVGLSGTLSFDNLLEMLIIQILIYRNEGSRQMRLDLAPLSTEELSSRDNSSVKNAAEIFLHEKYKIPYYYGMDTVCTLATNNVEELLSIAAELYDGLRAKKILRKADLVLLPNDQEKLIKIVAKRKRDFIPKTHTEGVRAQCLLDSIGFFCREKTFLPSAPYSPGVTGVRLSDTEILRLHTASGEISEDCLTLRKVLSECIAENLLVCRASAPTTGREGGTIFYINRTLCAHYGLPVQKGGWQDVQLKEMISWMKSVRKIKSKKQLEI